MLHFSIVHCFTRKRGSSRFTRKRGSSRPEVTLSHRTLEPQQLTSLIIALWGSSILSTSKQKTKYQRLDGVRKGGFLMSVSNQGPPSHGAVEVSKTPDFLNDKDHSKMQGYRSFGVYTHKICALRFCVNSLVTLGLCFINPLQEDGLRSLAKNRSKAVKKRQ